MMFEIGMAFVIIVVLYIAGTIIYFKFRHQRIVVKKQLDAMNDVLSSEANKVKLEKEVADLMQSEPDKEGSREAQDAGKSDFSGVFDSNTSLLNLVLKDPLAAYLRTTALTPEILSALYSLIQSREGFLLNLSRARSKTTDKFVLQKLDIIEQRYKDEFERETRSLGQISSYR